MAWHREKATKVNELVVRERHNRHRRRHRRRRRFFTSTASILLETGFHRSCRGPLEWKKQKKLFEPFKKFWKS